jgi:hypothetical protein
VEAAIEYDKVCYQIYKENANTNNLLNNIEVRLNINTEFKVKEKPIRNLPKYISHAKNNRFRVKFAYDKNKICIYTNTLDEAKLILENELVKKQNYENNKKNKQLTQNIIYHNDIPIILAKSHYNIYIIYVDADIWHHLNNYKWHIHNNYCIGTINGKIISMHAYIYLYYNNISGTIYNPIDHININKFDNRIQNLRIVSASSNNQNKEKNKNCSSKYIGVYKNKKKWISTINKNYKKYYLGSFINEVDAAIAYNNKAIELYGNNCKINNLPNPIE